MQPKKTEPDFDDTMRRLMGLPAERAKAIVKRTAPAKPKAEREGKRARKKKPRRK